MGRCLIFCAAEFDTLAVPLEKGDCVIAADGGLRHLKKLGIQPDIILGDFDSLGSIPKMPGACCPCSAWGRMPTA